MKVTSIEISGFRAFRDSVRLDLDGDVVLVAGVNGQGKTSIFDAIHWAITGHISRLQNPDSVVSIYSSSGEARVTVVLGSGDGRRITVTRRFDGEEDSLLVRVDDDTFREADAEYELLRLLWPNALAAGQPQEALRSALERGVYLQQDLLTDFLVADTDQDRFQAIGELVGVGRITEFQAALERSRRAWSRITNERMAGITSVEDQLTRLDAQLRELVEADVMAGPTESEWNTWWVQAKRLGVSAERVPRVDSADSHSAIDIAMAELRALRSSLERRGDRLRDLSLTLRELTASVGDLDALRSEADEAAQAVEAAQSVLSDAEEEVAESRRRQLAIRSEQEELRAFAELTLRHLGQNCPVCQQTYDIDSTRERLESLLIDIPPSVSPPLDQLGLIGLMKDLQAMRERSRAASTAFQDAQHQEWLRIENQNRVRAGLVELSIDVPQNSNAAGVIESALRDNQDDLERISMVSHQGEALALALAQSRQLARKSELEREVLRVKRDLSIVRSEIRARQVTWEVVSKMIDGLRDASSELVEDELLKLEPLLQRIYATADPHPEFRTVRLLTRMYRGQGRVLAQVEDPLHNQRRNTPSAYLSSSQMNVLAVSVFLALNLGIPTLPLNVAILDDPLQSLDDLNLLGLIDLLKRLRERRQLMISTHDRRFASLLERKLRPVSDSQRTILVELSGWSSDGPTAVQSDIAQDLVPIRIAAA